MYKQKGWGTRYLSDTLLQRYEGDHPTRAMPQMQLTNLYSNVKQVVLNLHTAYTVNSPTPETNDNTSLAAGPSTSTPLYDQCQEQPPGVTISISVIQLQSYHIMDLSYLIIR